MRTYISYVIQDESGHKHLSEIITSTKQTYAYSDDSHVSDVIDWANKKTSDLKPGQELVVINMFRI
jgi:hypothetical protein